MRIKQAFPSKFINADDIGSARPTVIIADVKMEEVSDNEMKPVVYFHGKQKGMVLNKTNAEMIAHLYGDETDNWRGQPVDLYTTMVTFGNKSQLGIRVMATVPQMPAHGSAPLPAGVTQGMPPGRQVHPAPNPNAPSDFVEPSTHGQSVGAPAPAPQGGGDLDDEIPF